MASVLDLVRHYQHNIEKYPHDEQKVLKAIDKLFSLDVKVTHLQETGVGRTVNALRKEPGNVGSAARSLVYKWKEMVAAEESDQEGDYETSTNGKDYDDNAKQPVTQNNDYEEKYRTHSPQKSIEQNHEKVNGDHRTSKRKNQNSENEVTESKRSRHSSSHSRHSNHSEAKSSHSDTKSNHSETKTNHSETKTNHSETKTNHSETKMKHVNIKKEPESESQSDSENDDSDSESSDDHSEEETKVKVKIEPEDKHDRSQTKYNHAQIKQESSSSKKSHESSHSHHSSKHHNSDSSKHNSDKHSDKISKDKRSSIEKSSKENSDKSYKENRSSDEKRSKEESKSKHGSEKHRSSSNKTENGSQKNDDKKKDKYSSNSEKEKHKSSSDKDTQKNSIDKEKAKDKSLSESQSSSDKHKSRESSSKHKSSSSKEKSNDKDRSSSSKEKSSSSHKSDKKHSSEKSRSEKSKSKSESNEDNNKRESSQKSSSSSHKHKSSSSKSKEDIPKKKVKISEDGGDSDDGIGCESGTSFADALGMITPAKTKKKNQIKDANSPGNAVSNDLSPASLLAPTAKLAPLPAIEISALPEISPNYKPRPPPKFLPHFTDEDAISAGISTKNQRTKVYSGNKTLGKVPTLYEMCVQILQEHIDALEYTGGVPYEILKPVVDKATPQQLYMLEHFNPYLIEDTDHLWQKFCEKHFRGKKRQELETWREMFARCQEEQEYKLKSLTANIKMTQEAKKAPIKQTKMAYVDSVVKPPRNIARKQALHGTAYASSASPAARVAALATAPNVLKTGSVRPPPAPSMSSSSANRPKKAPLMQKALQFMRGRKR